MLFCEFFLLHCQAALQNGLQTIRFPKRCFLRKKSLFFVAWRRAWLLDNLPLRNRPHNNHCHRMYHRIHHRAHHHSDDAFWKRNIPEVLESCIGNDLPEQNGIRRSRKIFGECGCVWHFFVPGGAVSVPTCVQVQER